jgi:hypothetical protein
MPNARDGSGPHYHRILLLGSGGSGKTTQLRTLPGRKFAYLFDPAALASLQGCDIDYEQFLPDALELDMALRGFNKGSQTDAGKLASKREPTTYMRWAADINKRADEGFFQTYDWLCIDSLTLLSDAIMDRQKWLNGRYGGIEDLADFRIVGSKIADTFRSICSLPVNIVCTGHMQTFQDDKTKRIDTQISLPGRARNMLPLLMGNIWECRSTADEKQQYVILTRSEPRGFQGLRTTIAGLQPVMDVTIKDFARAEQFGIGALLKNAKPRMSAVAPVPVPQSKPPAAASGASTAAPQPSASPK